MFYHDPRLVYTVRVDKPNPAFARMLQQAIGGVEGEMRVMNQYLFQGCNARGPKKYRDMLMNTATEEIGHIEMLATAVAMNLEGAPTQVKEEAASDPIVAARLGGTQPRHVLSSGGGAMPVDANGAPFTGAFVVGTGNLGADMFANVHAEANGRLLATRLYEATDDPGMKGARGTRGDAGRRPSRPTRRGIDSARRRGDGQGEGEAVGRLETGRAILRPAGCQFFPPAAAETAAAGVLTDEAASFVRQSRS